MAADLRSSEIFILIKLRTHRLYQTIDSEINCADFESLISIDVLATGRVHFLFLSSPHIRSPLSVAMTICTTLKKECNYHQAEAKKNMERALIICCCQVNVIWCSIWVLWHKSFWWRKKERERDDLSSEFNRRHHIRFLFKEIASNGVTHWVHLPFVLFLYIQNFVLCLT